MNFSFLQLRLVASVVDHQGKRYGLVLHVYNHFSILVAWRQLHALAFLLAVAAFSGTVPSLPDWRLVFLDHSLRDALRHPNHLHQFVPLVPHFHPWQSSCLPNLESISTLDEIPKVGNENERNTRVQRHLPLFTNILPNFPIRTNASSSIYTLTNTPCR